MRSLRTWHFETAAVAAVLALTALLRGRGVEWIGALAVLLSFGHASIGDRMAAKQAAMVKPDVDCWRWSVRYFVAKEAAWVAYFLFTGCYSALVGCGVFLLHPLWRRWYRRRWPR